LLDALSAAGGTTAKAGQTVTITHRDRPNAPEKIHFTPGKEAESNVQLHAGDIVMVSQAGIVYVVGDVKQPTGIVLENPSLTVLQAIAMAQGTTPTAKLNSAKLIRKSANGGQQEIAIPLKNILESKAPDVQLQANDIVFIPNSAGKSAARKGLETALQAVVGLSVYRP
jgi:polysaccharide export outer membrane protein